MISAHPVIAEGGGFVNKIIYVGKHALTMTVSRHLHSSCELIFCTSGCGEMIFDDRIMRYGTNDIVVVPPYLPHANISKEGFTNIHINMEESTLNQAEPMIVPADPNGFLLSAFSAAFYYYSSAEAEYRSVLLPLYGQLIAASLAIRKQKSPHSEIVQKIENDILENYPDSSYDPGPFLNTLPFSEGYLKKMFKKETGLTPLQYLTEKRLENAASCLAMNGGSGNISDIAYQCGFSEPLYFSRLFKRKYGVSPRHYPSKQQGPLETDRPDDLKIML